MDVGSFCRVRPRLYHLTAAENVERILAGGGLAAAAGLYAEAGCAERARVRRPESERVRVNGDVVHIRDQAPLFAGNVTLQDAWAFEDLVEHLNGHVFFWPGRDQRPIDYGQRHFARYQNEACKVLVVNTAALVEANAGNPPLFCRHNSGSPRCHPKAGKSPRGPDTFLAADRFGHSPGRVVEVVFRDRVSLPREGLEVREPADFL